MALYGKNSAFQTSSTNRHINCEVFDENAHRWDESNRLRKVLVHKVIIRKEPSTTFNNLRSQVLEGH